jgi:flagellar biosynthesis GTPase FlhF
MATESNVRSAQVRTYRGRTLEEILPQIREELGPDAIILREREGLVGGVGGFFAQRFVEVDARRGDGQSIDIYDDSPDDELGLDPSLLDDGVIAERQRPALPEVTEAPAIEAPAPEEPMDFSARRQSPVDEPVEPSQPRPFDPPVVQRERIIPKEPEPQPERKRRPRAFETDVFLERLRAASAILPDEDDELNEPSAGAVQAAPLPPATTPQPEPAPPAELPGPDASEAAQTKPRRPERPAASERKPRSPQRARAKPVPRKKPAPQPQAQPAPEETQPQAPAAQFAPPQPAAKQAPEPQLAPPQQAANPYEAVRVRPPSLSAGLPTASPVTPAASAVPHAPAAIPAAVPAAFPAPPRPLEIRGAHHDGGIRGAIARLFGGRFGHSAMPRPSTPRPIDPVAATEVAAELATRGASREWTSQLITTAGAHGSALAGSLRAAAEAEIARRIVPPPALPVTGTAIAFIGGGGTGKTRCTAALASAYSRASTLGVTVIALDNPDGARELKRLLSDDGVPVLSLSGERAHRAIEAARQGGFVIVDTPAVTPTHPDEVEALSLKLAPLELDATFVTLPATLGPEAARRALASFGRLRPSAVAITHADETDQLGVVVEIAIAHRIPLAYVHAGTDHRNAITAVDPSAIAQQLLTT